jgi:hypothetical protein
MREAENDHLYNLTSADLARLETLINLLGDAVFELFQLRKSNGCKVEIPQPTFQELEFYEEHFKTIHDIEHYF